MQFLPERGEDHQLPVFIKQISQLFSSILISIQLILGYFSGHLRVSDLILDQSNFTL